MSRTKMSWSARVVGFALLLVVAMRIASFGLADLLAKAEPDIAIIFNGGHSVARVELSNRALASGQPDLQSAMGAAQEALSYNPLAPGALAAIARVTEQMGDETSAYHLMLRAARTAPRDMRSQIWLLDYEIRKGEISAATARIDVIFRGQNSNVWGTLLTALMPVVVHDRFRAEFAELLTSNPPWRSVILRYIAQQTNNVSGLQTLVQTLQASQSPLSPEELRDYLNRLFREKLWDQAYISWLQSLPQERLGNLGFLYNAEFQYALSGLPFDWVFSPVQGALISVVKEGNSQALQIDFFGGRVAFNHVSHALALPPGRYRLKGQEQALGLRSERGLRWRISCLDDPASSLAVSPVLTGDIQPRRIDVAFQVPESNCSFQALTLELPATVAIETEIAGKVVYRGMNIEPVTQ